MVKEEEFPCTGKLPPRQDRGCQRGEPAKPGPMRQNTEKAALPSP